MPLPTTAAIRHNAVAGRGRRAYSCVVSRGRASWSVSARTTRSRPRSLAAYMARSALASSSWPSRRSESVATPMLMLTPATPATTFS